MYNFGKTQRVMTVDRTKKDIIIPGWLFQTLISILLSAFIVYGAIASARSDLDRAKQDIEVLRQEKVGKDVMDIVIKKLDSIEKKVDEQRK